ncbi:MAG: hypothetical protein M3Q95_00180 [Bacteroidota bacterium]|nr:hypothetical protein [Bacteroidota bacterium]
MDKQQEQLETLREIRSLMEHSTRFISLSGLSGVIAGIVALLGVVAAYIFLDMGIDDPGYYKHAINNDGTLNETVYNFFVIDIFIVFLVSLIAATVLTRQKAKQQERPVWDAIAKRLLVNILIPLITGAVFCLILLYHNYIALIAPVTLIFYGLSLLNASRYTLNDVRYLGIVEIVTGLIATFEIEYGLLFWAFGFGVAHIVYGIAMYFKYEK